MRHGDSPRSIPGREAPRTGLREARSARPSAPPGRLGTGDEQAGREIDELETTGRADETFLAEVVAALEIPDEEIAPVLAAENRLREERHAKYLADWNRWADEPIRAYLVGVPVPGFSFIESLPDEALVSLEAAEAATVDRIRKIPCRYALVWSRRLTVWFDRGGAVLGRTEAHPGEPNVPYAKIRGRSVVLELRE